MGFSVAHSTSRVGHRQLIAVDAMLLAVLQALSVRQSVIASSSLVGSLGRVQSGFRIIGTSPLPLALQRDLPEG